MNITYTQISPIVHSTNLAGMQLNVEFKSEDQDTPIAAVGMMVAEQADMNKEIKKTMVKQGIIGIIVSSIGRVVGGLIGGVGGSAAHSAVSMAGSAATQGSMDPSKMMMATDTPANREQAVLEALQSVQSFYEWDNPINKWKAKPIVAPESTPVA